MWSGIYVPAFQWNLLLPLSGQLEVTNSLKQSPCLEANSRSFGHCMEPKHTSVCTRACHWCLPFSQMNPVRNVIHCFFEIHVNIILLSTPTLPTLSLPFRFFKRMFLYIFLLFSLCYMSQPSSYAVSTSVASYPFLMLNYTNVFEHTVYNRRNFPQLYCQISRALYNHVVKCETSLGN